MARSGFDSIYCKKESLIGLEKIINLIKNFILSASFSINGILYGKSPVVEKTQPGNQPNSVKKSKKQNPIDKALEKGLIEVLKDLSSVDFCSLLNYSIASSGFNSRQRPDGGPALSIWKIQNSAYQLQLQIDKNLGEITNVLTPDATLRLTDLLIFTSDFIRNKIVSEISESQIQFTVNQENRAEFADENVARYFKRLLYFQTILLASAEVLERLGSNITVGSAQKAVNNINKIRSTLILIQGLNNPALVLSLANQLTRGAVQDQFAKINRLIPVQSLIPLLKRCIKLCVNINSVGQKILGSIATIQFFVRVAITVIKVLTIIRRFFLFGFQLPNVFTTVAVTTTTANLVEESLNQKGIKKLIERLQQINSTLCITVNFVSSFLIAVNEILPVLRSILLNIESCNNIDDDIKQDLSNAIDSLTDTRNRLQEFINSVNNTTNQASNSFGEYTIEIVTEQVVDEGINLKRRFGIARGKNNTIAVQSTPTFASLDLIIVNEVKSLLVAKGLVKVGLSGISNEDLAVLTESVGFLADQNISLDNLDSVNLEPPQIEEGENSSDLGLGTFVTNLPGGRSLRNRVRDKLIKNNENLIKNLRTADPSSEGTQKIVKQKELETNKLKIEKLEDQKASLKKNLLLTAANPALASAIILKIKEIDEEIKALKNKIK